jgi:hypothetical protein
MQHLALIMDRLGEQLWSVWNFLIGFLGGFGYLFDLFGLGVGE